MRKLVAFVILAAAAMTVNVGVVLAGPTPGQQGGTGHDWFG
jgi:hypothetical protein